MFESLFQRKHTHSGNMTFRRSTKMKTTYLALLYVEYFLKLISPLSSLIYQKQILGKYKMFPEHLNNIKLCGFFNHTMLSLCR